MRIWGLKAARTFPADIVLVVDDYKESLRDKLLAQKNIIDIERQEMVGGREQPGGDP